MNSIIDDLILIKYLNSGCFSETYLTIKEGTNQLFATKRISLEKISEEPSFKEHLQNEIMILKQVQHPNIIKLYDVKVKKDYVYLIMEYCNGGSLLEVLNYYKQSNGRPFTENIVQYLMKQILTAVEFLHKNGIIHRDLDLENILLKYNSQSDADNNNILLSQVKIIDFNISCKIENNNYQMNGEESLYMTQAFFTNEFNEIADDEKIDIWALGALCYEMLTGEKPYKIEKKIQPIKTVNIIIPKNISLLAQSFLSSMLMKDRDERFTSTQLLNHEFITRNINESQNNNNNKKSCSPHVDKVIKIFGTQKKEIRHIQISKPLYKSQTYSPLKLYNSKIEDEIKYSNRIVDKKPIFKKYIVGNNIDVPKLNIITTSCTKFYIKCKDGKNIAKLSAEEIKDILGDEWLVFISDIKCREFDFNISPALKDDFAVFSLDNRFFQVFRYK